MEFETKLLKIVKKSNKISLKNRGRVATSNAGRHFARPPTKEYAMSDVHTAMNAPDTETAKADDVSWLDSVDGKGKPIWHKIDVADFSADMKKDFADYQAKQDIANAAREVIANKALKRLQPFTPAGTECKISTKWKSLAYHWAPKTGAKTGKVVQLSKLPTKT